jgi:phosphomannomutase
MKPDIFRSYDIRGVVPDDLEAADAYHIGRAYAAHTNAQEVVVAHDMRLSGKELEAELVRGLVDSGVNVIRIGLATSPLFYFAVHHLKADGGIMVTASHNPGKYNGFKMTRAEAVPIAGDSGLMDIRDLALKQEWSPAATPGTVREASVKENYLDSAVGGQRAEGLKIVVDTGNGMAGFLMADVFKRIGGEVVPLYWELDGSFPHHEADPLKLENLKDLQAAVQREKAHLGVAFDGDGDRVFFCTETGDVVPGDLATALIAQELVREQPGATILYDLRASRAVKEAVEEAGGQATMSRVGHSHIKAQMRATNAIFAGEVSGHFYFTPWYAESGLRAMMIIITLLQTSGQPLSALVKPLQRYAKTPEINFEIETKDEVLQRLRDHFSDAEILTLDGLTLSYPDWWANVRASNTEPVLRLNMEAKTVELLREKQSEIEKIITS